MQKQKTPFDNVNIEWNLTHDEGSTDFSDDETVIEDRVRILNRKITYEHVFFILMIKFIIERLRNP